MVASQPERPPPLVWSLKSLPQDAVLMLCAACLAGRHPQPTPGTLAITEEETGVALSEAAPCPHTRYAAGIPDFVALAARYRRVRRERGEGVQRIQSECRRTAWLVVSMDFADQHPEALPLPATRLLQGRFER